MSATLCWSARKRRRMMDIPTETNHAEAASDGDFNEAGEVDWNSQSFATDRGTLEASLGTELSNTFDDDRPPTPAEHAPSGEGLLLSSNSWSGAPGPAARQFGRDQSRSLCRGPTQPARAPFRAIGARHQRSGRTCGRPGDHRFHRRHRLFDGPSGRGRVATRRAA